jgi:hypothetical protein
MLLREERDPLSAFTYALKALETRRQYPRRLKVFFDFMQFDGPLEEQTKHLLIRARTDLQWAQDSLMALIDYQIDRTFRHEIAESTISNYYKATKLFCEMNDLILSWKKIARGLPHGRKSANDRAPMVDELQKLIEYPDRE